MVDATSYASKADRPLQMPSVLGVRTPDTVEERVQERIRTCSNLEELATSLRLLLAGGFDVWDDGRLIETRVLVARINRLRIEIHTREHQPPHFHVSAPGLAATFAIDDCQCLDGTIGGKERRLVEHWHKTARRQLVRVWNETRPSDCPVGPINE